MRNDRLTRALTIALLIVAMASFQAGASVAKAAFHLVGPIGIVTLRILFGTLILAAFLKPWRARIGAGSRPALLIYGVALGVMNLLFYLSLERIPLGIAVALEFTGPLSVAVLASRQPIDFGWAALAAAGLLLLSPLASLGGRLDPLGVGFALGAGVCWALYIVFGQRAGADHGTRTVALGSLIAAITIVPIGMLTVGPRLLSPSLILPGLAIATFSTAIPYTIEMYALTRIPTRTFGILMSLEPACGALFGRILLHESLRATQWTAIALVVLASIGSSVSSRRAQPTPAVAVD